MSVFSRLAPHTHTALFPGHSFLGLFTCPSLVVSGFLFHWASYLWEQAVSQLLSGAAQLSPPPPHLRGFIYAPPLVSPLSCLLPYLMRRRLQPLPPVPERLRWLPSGWNYSGSSTPTSCATRVASMTRPCPPLLPACVRGNAPPTCVRPGRACALGAAGPGPSRGVLRRR